MTGQTSCLYVLDFTVDVLVRTFLYTNHSFVLAMIAIALASAEYSGFTVRSTPRYFICLTWRSTEFWRLNVSLEHIFLLRCSWMWYIELYRRILQTGSPKALEDGCLFSETGWEWYDTTDIPKTKVWLLFSCRWSGLARFVCLYCNTRLLCHFPRNCPRDEQWCSGK